MALNKGKKFEAIFENTWITTFGKNSILRLADQMSGYKVTSQNPCDYICYKKPRMFLIECKETTQNTLNWKAFPQFDRLCEYVDVDGIVAGVLIWYQQHNKVIFVSIKDCIKMKANGKKSINIKDLESDDYQILEIPTVVPRVYPVIDLAPIPLLPENW